MQRAVAHNWVESLRSLWGKAVDPTTRSSVIGDRYHIVFLEEAETFKLQEITRLRWLLMRLAKDYPAADPRPLDNLSVPGRPVGLSRRNLGATLTR